MDNPPERRRMADARIDTLVQQVNALQKEMTANTEITRQVADVLASFRVMAAIAKWCSAIAVGVSAVWHGIDFISHK